MTHGGDQRAKELAVSISEKNDPPSVQHMNRIYDIVLNMNSLNAKPRDGIIQILSFVDLLSQIMEEKK